MFKKLLIISVLGLTLSGCFMAPLALIGPAASGFSTASIIQSGITSTASYVVKKNTGKSIGQHTLDAITPDFEKVILAQTYFPKRVQSLPVAP
jgi:hypothetical protein